jgi:hypothetical protein
MYRKPKVVILPPPSFSRRMLHYPTYRGLPDKWHSKEEHLKSDMKLSRLAMNGNKPIEPQYVS